MNWKSVDSVEEKIDWQYNLHNVLFCICYGLEVCVPTPPRIHMLKPNPQCDGIWRWEFWKVIRSQRWSSYVRISALTKDSREFPHPLPSWTRKRVPDTTSACALILDSSNQNCEKYISIVYETPSLSHFVIADQAD